METKMNQIKQITCSLLLVSFLTTAAASHQTNEKALLTARNAAIENLDRAFQSKSLTYIPTFEDMIKGLHQGSNKSTAEWKMARDRQLESWLLGIELLNKHTAQDFDFSVKPSTTGSRGYAAEYKFNLRIVSLTKRWLITFLRKVSGAYLDSRYEISKQQGIKKVLSIINNTVKSPVVKSELMIMVNKFQTCNQKTIQHEIESGNSLCPEADS
jgi:hypothetical protein